MSRALVTDLYEVNMAASYLRRGMVGPATFSLFVRKLPPERGYLVAAGLEACLDYLEGFRFDDEDLDWLAGAGFPPEDVAAFAALRFTGEVHAVPEGRLVLADEPLLEVTAPLPEAQLVETYLLNQLTYQTALATKACRCRLAAGPIELVEFSLRRTHGTEAALAVARASAIAGFVGTSNVDAARRLGTTAMGTMAHSYVEAFATEHDAFRAFAADLPGRPITFLVDTYDTLDGVRAAIDVVRELELDRKLPGRVGVRLDSGDLSVLARQSRELLDRAGLADVRIFVSGSLDEHRLERLRLDRAPVDAAGVGTRLGVSADAPYLDSAYKLVALGDRPVAKLSTGKAHLPGAKQVWRSTGSRSDDGSPGDVIALRDEPPLDDHEPLLVPVLRHGRRVASPTSLDAARARLEADLAVFPPEALRTAGPTAPPLAVSHRLRAAAEELAARHRHRGGEEAATSGGATTASDAAAHQA